MVEKSARWSESHSGLKNIRGFYLVLYVCVYVCVCVCIEKIFIPRDREEREKGRETLISCLLCAPYWGPGPKPGPVL